MRTFAELYQEYEEGRARRAAALHAALHPVFNYQSEDDQGDSAHGESEHGESDLNEDDQSEAEPTEAELDEINTHIDQTDEPGSVLIWFGDHKGSRLDRLEEEERRDLLSQARRTLGNENVSHRRWLPCCFAPEAIASAVSNKYSCGHTPGYTKSI